MSVLSRVAAIALVAGGMALGRQAVAAPLPAFTIVTGNGSAVTALFIGFNAGDTDTVSVVAGLANFFVNNATAPGTPANLGVFASGAEIQFQVTDMTVPATFFSGPGSRNADGFIHANVTTDLSAFTGLSAASLAFAATLPLGTVYIGFEDRTGTQADFDYNDIVFAVQNGSPATVPEPASIALLGAGLIGIGLSRRRKAG